MTKSTIIGALLLALAASATPAAARPAQSPPAAQATALSALADQLTAPERLPGAVFSIGSGDAPPVIVARGRIGIDPASPAADGDTLWRLYSMTKPVTAMAAMILIEEGKLRLDQPISDFFPAYKSMRVLVDPTKDLTSVPATRPITVRNLLTHTAGLGYTIVTKGPLLDAYRKAGIEPSAVNLGYEKTVRPLRPANLEEFANRVATLPLIAEPGTVWSYSIGLDVLAAVIEKAAGMPFEQFVQTRLFTPLGMTSSYFTVPASETRRLADNVVFFGTQRGPLDPGNASVFAQPPSFPYGGAGLVASARDYDRLLMMLQNGGNIGNVRVMKPETVRLALSNLLPAGVTYRDEELGVPMGFGAGGSITLADVPGGPGKGSYFWGGAANTTFWVDVPRRQRFVGMVNAFPPGVLKLRGQFIKAAYAR